MNEQTMDTIVFEETKLMGEAATWYKQNKEMLTLAAMVPTANELVKKIQTALMETISGDAATALATAQNLLSQLSRISFDVPYTGLSQTMTKAHQPATPGDGRYRYSGKSQGMVDQSTGEG